ncbi:MAG: hypothetical protein J6T51_07490 [Kiritimatiellae bacterium]|nr:hypothetical protein [Kiritimatiellia bacterium]
MSAGILLAAALKVLTALGSPGEFSEAVPAQEAQVFERAGRIVAAQNGRRAKWDRYLGLMGIRESRPSLAAVRYRLAVGSRVYSFTVYGRLFVDMRFVRDDELGDVLALERAFREMHARSPWRGEKMRDARLEPLALCGYEDERFLRLDGPLARVVDEFNRTRGESVHELSPRLFKSFVVEEACWRDGVPSEAELREALRRLAAAGGRPGGPFRGWYAAVQDARGAGFAQRVASRSSHPEVFVPARAWKEKVQ